MLEIVSSRVLGAIRFIDAATGSTIDRPLRLQAPQLTIRRNRKGSYVIVDANDEGLRKHINSFAVAPSAPIASSLNFEVSVEDPLGDFLPASFSVRLPRQSAPDKATEIDSIFQPIAVSLFSSPSRSLAANWCAVRASVINTEDKPVAGAGLRLECPAFRVDPFFAVTTRTGEAMIPLPGLPFLFVSTEANNTEVIKNTTSAVLKAFLHEDGNAVTLDMLRNSDNKLKFQVEANLTLAAATSIHQTFKVNP
jgi:hypothetical protein